jgi:hypothetical protein
MAQKVVVSISLDTEGDRDILRWLGQQENQSAAVRKAIREHLGRGGVTLGDVYQVVARIERRLEAGVVVNAEGRTVTDAEWDEPAEAAAALDALAELG